MLCYSFSGFLFALYGDAGNYQSGLRGNIRILSRAKLLVKGCVKRNVVRGRRDAPTRRAIRIPIFTCGKASSSIGAKFFLLLLPLFFFLKSSQLEAIEPRKLFSSMLLTILNSNMESAGHQVAPTGIGGQFNSFKVQKTRKS